MNQKGNLLFLKSVLLVSGILALIYGIAYCFFPEALVKLYGGDPVYHGWLRWSGGTLIAIGTGTMMVFRKPVNQRIFVFTISLVTLLVGLSLSYSLADMDSNDPVLFTAIPAFLLLLISTLLWISQWKARDILGSLK